MTQENMGQENIILTGFMGTGKTTVGTLLAKNLGYGFVDTDQLIEEKCGMSVPAFFKRKGETAFREMERGVAKELGEQSSLVISTGGGFMLDPVNAEIVGKTGKVFCLVATPEEILNRISEDSGADRPLLQGKNPRERIVELLKERQEGYTQFLQLITSHKTPLQIVEQLIQLLQEPA